MGCIACQVYNTGLPIWGLIIALGISLVLQLCLSILKAVTNTELSDNVIAEFIAGYVISNRPIANMIFKAYSSVTCLQSVQFAADLSWTLHEDPSAHHVHSPDRGDDNRLVCNYWRQCMANGKYPRRLYERSAVEVYMSRHTLFLQRINNIRTDRTQTDVQQWEHVPSPSNTDSSSALCSPSPSISSQSATPSPGYATLTFT